jgi:hypothetical protein
MYYREDEGLRTGKVEDSNNANTSRRYDIVWSARADKYYASISEHEDALEMK